MKRLFLGAALMMLLAPAVAEAQINQTNQTTQTVRGQVRDVASDEPMIGVTITIENGMTMGSVTDADGNFEIKDVPVGRHSVRATYIGYEPVLLKEQLVTSGKELVITLKMRESISELGEVVIKPRVNKQQPLNEMAQVGARMFSVEEASRYAGGMADPARTASMFAGVATGGATNGISIHGNSPQMLLWRVEGVEVPNPNHFAEITEAGGGVFTSLNGTVLANSDFLTGAMPAEYGNTYEEVMKRPDKSIPVDEGADPFNKQKGMNVGYAFSVKYTINKRNTSHHFILEYLQMKTFQGETFDIRTHEIVDEFTSLTFPNIAYRVEF